MALKYSRLQLLDDWALKGALCREDTKDMVVKSVERNRIKTQKCGQKWNKKTKNVDKSGIKLESVHNSGNPPY